MTTAKDREPEKREDNGAGDADGDDWGAGCCRAGCGAVGAAVLLGMERIVGDGDVLILRNRGGGLELAGVELAVSVVVEGDAEFFAGLEAEGEDTEAGRLVAAGGDGGFDGDPGWFGHKVLDAMRGMPSVARAALVSWTEPGRLTGRVASSMTMVSKPRRLPSMAE